MQESSEEEKNAMHFSPSNFFKLLLQNSSNYTTKSVVVKRCFIMNIPFLNANNIKNKDLREWNPRKVMSKTWWSLLPEVDSLKSLFLKLFAFNKCPSRRGGHNGHK